MGRSLDDFDLLKLIGIVHMRNASLLLAVVLTSVMPTVCKAADTTRVVHVFVALADNEHQGIVPVSARLGNGEDLDNNLYWGAAYGIRTFFARDKQWSLISKVESVKPDTVLQRCVFRHKSLKLYLIADAYKGERIREAVTDFLATVAGRGESVPNADLGFSGHESDSGIHVNMAAYIGHNGLMDFDIPVHGLHGDSTGLPTIILACVSKGYFKDHLMAIKADPVLWTTGLMAPEAYTLKAAVESWAAGRSRSEIRAQAAAAYHQYQHCGETAARRLLVTGY